MLSSVKANHVVWWRECGLSGPNSSIPVYLLLITYEDGRFILTRTNALGNLRSHDMDREDSIPGEITQGNASSDGRILIQDTPFLLNPIPLPPDRLQNIYSLIRSNWGEEGNGETVWVLEVEERPLRVRVAGDKVTVGWRHEGDGKVSLAHEGQRGAQNHEEADGTRSQGGTNSGPISESDGKGRLQVSWQWFQAWLLNLLQWFTSLVLWHWEASQSVEAARGTYWTIGRRRVHLASLGRQDAMAAVEARLAAADWSGALKTAERWGVPTDIVWKARWLDAPVTKETVSSLLSQIQHDLPWVLDTCVVRVASDPQGQRALLNHGLKCMEEEWAMEGIDEEWRETLVKYRLILLRYLARLNSYLFITKAMRYPDSELRDEALTAWLESDTEDEDDEEDRAQAKDETMGWEDSFMVLEEKARLMRDVEENPHHFPVNEASSTEKEGVTRLEDIMLLEAELDSFPADFTHFRDVNILAQAMEYAYQGFFPALRVLLVRHHPELTGFIHLILDQVPLTTPPSLYLPLLPGADDKQEKETIDLASKDYIHEDWIFRQGWAKRVGWIEDGDDLHFSPFPIRRQVPEDKDDVAEGMNVVDRRLSWIYLRAREVEAGTGNLDLALQILSPAWCKDPQGRASEWKGRTRRLRRLLHWLSRWVYEYGKVDWTLEDLEDTNKGGVWNWARNLMAGLSGDAWVTRWTESLAPFLTQVLSTEGQGGGIGLFGIPGWEEESVREAVSGVVLQAMGQGDILAIRRLLALVRAEFTHDQREEEEEKEEEEERKEEDREKEEREDKISSRNPTKQKEALKWVKILLHDQEWKALLLACAYSEGCTGSPHAKGSGKWESSLAHEVWWKGPKADEGQGVRHQYQWLRQVIQDRYKSRVGRGAHTLPADLYQALLPATRSPASSGLKAMPLRPPVDLEFLGTILHEEHLSIGILLHDLTLMSIGLAASGDRGAQEKVLDGFIHQTPKDVTMLQEEVRMLREHGYLPPAPPSVIHTLGVSLLHRERYSLVGQWLDLVKDDAERRDLILAIIDVTQEALDSVEGRGDEGDTECVRRAEACLSLLPSSLDDTLPQDLQNRVQAERSLQQGLYRLRKWGFWRSPVSLRGSADAPDEVMRLMRMVLSTQPQRTMTLEDVDEVEEVWHDLMRGSMVNQDNQAIPYWRWRLAMVRTCRSESRMIQALTLLHNTAKHPWGGLAIMDDVEMELRALWQHFYSEVADMKKDELDTSMKLWEEVFGSLMAMDNVGLTEMEVFIRLYEDWEELQMNTRTKRTFERVSGEEDSPIHVYALYGQQLKEKGWSGQFASQYTEGKTSEREQEAEEFKRALESQETPVTSGDKERLFQAFTALRMDLMIALTYLQALDEVSNLPGYSSWLFMGNTLTDPPLVSIHWGMD